MLRGVGASVLVLASSTNLEGMELRPTVIPTARYQHSHFLKHKRCVISLYAFFKARFITFLFII